VAREKPLLALWPLSYGLKCREWLRAVNRYGPYAEKVVNSPSTFEPSGRSERMQSMATSSTPKVSIGAVSERVGTQ